MANTGKNAIKDQFLKLRNATLFSSMFGKLYAFVAWLDLAEQGRIKDNHDNDPVYVKSVKVRHDEWLAAIFQLQGVEFELLFSPLPVVGSSPNVRPSCYGIRRIKRLWQDEEFDEDDLKELCPALAGWRPLNADYWYYKAALALTMSQAPTHTTPVATDSQQ